MPITKKDAPDTLPDQAKEIFVSAFNNAYKTTCKDPKKRKKGGTQDACASRIAWGAVKQKYKQVDDKWTAKAWDELDEELVDYIARAAVGAPVSGNTAHGQGGLLNQSSTMGEGKCVCAKCSATSNASGKCSESKCPECGGNMKKNTKALFVRAVPNGLWDFLSEHDLVTGGKEDED